MQEKMRRRLGIALWMLGFIILLANGVGVIGHYLVGRSISLPSIAVGIVFLTLGMMTSNKKRTEFEPISGKEKVVSSPRVTAAGCSMLQGNLVRLKPLAREDLVLFTEWNNDPDFGGEYEPFEPLSLRDTEKWYEKLGSSEGWFLIEKICDGASVGQIMFRMHDSAPRIGYRIVPTERGKGYCTEAVKTLVDHLFLSTNIGRVESGTNPENKASVRVLEKTGFTIERTTRKQVFVRGRWLDEALYHILREESEH
jgi:ribosomal-protein-alanine N-acetyltransferase